MAVKIYTSAEHAGRLRERHDETGLSCQDGQPFVAGDELARLRRLVDVLTAELDETRAALHEARAELRHGRQASIGFPGGFVVSEARRARTETITATPLPEWSGDHA